jgi:predicted acetyltransferase
MSLVYRAVPDDDAYRPVYRRLLRYAFAPDRGPEWDDDPLEQPGEFEPRGLYERPAGTGSVDESVAVAGRPPEATPDDVEPSALVVAGALLAFRMRIRGAWRPVGGVTAVASPPERRRRGHVGTLLDRMHDELRDRDVGIAALWPFAHPFYRRFGYGRAGDYVVCEFPPRALDAPAATPTTDDGCVRRLSVDDPDDVDALSIVHEAAAPEPLVLRRSADWWRLRIFRSWTSERFVYGWEDGTGTLRSYLAYRFESGESDGDGGGRRLVVDFWGAADEEAYRQLLAFLRNHDSQAATVRLVAGDAGLLDRFADPGDDVDTTVEPGPMVRVVDVERALSGLETSARGRVRVRVRVRDPSLDRNAGTFVVGVADGLTTCRRVDAGDRQAVAIDVGALSRLVVGARSAPALARLGRVEGDPETIARLDALLPEETPGPYLREWF